MPDKSLQKTVKSPAKAADNRQKVPDSADFLTWMPTDERTGRPLDGRSNSARQIRARLQSYAADLTRGKRPLTTAEAAGVRLLVSLELDHARALASQAKGARPADDITRLASEWRRCLSELGLRSPGALPDAAPAGVPAPAGEDPDHGWNLSLLDDDEVETLSVLAAKAAGQKPTGRITLRRPGLRAGSTIDIASLTDAETEVLAGALARLDAEAEAAKVIPDHDATVTALKSELSQLREKLAAQERLAALQAATMPASAPAPLPAPD